MIDLSYISGFMMGAAIGKGVRQFLGGGKKSVSPPSFALVSNIKGRRRYRVAKMSVQLAKLLEAKIGSLPYIKKIAANHITGSILIEYNVAYERQIDALMKNLRDRVFSVSKRALLPMTLPAKSQTTEAGSITISIRNSIRALSDWIKARTGGMFDVSSLAALLLMLRGIRKMLLTGQYPSGSSMLWWAASLMRGWRTV